MTLLTACMLIAGTCRAENSDLEGSSVLLQAQRAFATNGYETAWATYTANSSAFEAGIRSLDLEFLGWLMKRCHKEYGRVYGSRYLSLARAVTYAYYCDPKTDPLGYVESIFFLAPLVPEQWLIRAHLKPISEDDRIPRNMRDKALLRIADIDLSQRNYGPVFPVLSELATRTNTMTRASALLLTAQARCKREEHEKAQDALTKLPTEIPVDMQAQVASLRDSIQRGLAEHDRLMRMPIPCFGPFDVVDLKTGEPLVVPFTYTGPPYPKQAEFSTVARRGNARDAEIVAVQREGDSCRAEIPVAHGKAIPGDGVLQVEEDDLVRCGLTRAFKTSPAYKLSHTNRFAVHQLLAVRSVRSILDTSAMSPPAPNGERR